MKICKGLIRFIEYLGQSLAFKMQIQFLSEKNFVNSYEAETINTKHCKSPS